MLFFFKQKTAYELRISDWSSDVCSSDLIARMRRGPGGGLTVLGGSPSTITRFLAEYFLACGITPRQRTEAESAIALLGQAVREGRSHGREADGVGFRHALTDRKSVV